MHRLNPRALDDENEQWYSRFMRCCAPDAQILVVEWGGRPVGFAVTYLGDSVGYIDAIAVKPEFRGCGVGGALLHAVEESLVARGVTKVVLSVKADNCGAIRFYLRHGYAIKGTVLLLSARTREVKARLPHGYCVRAARRGLPVRRISKLMPLVWWLSAVCRADLRAYAALPETASIYAVKGCKVRGVCVFEVERDAVMDFVMVSYARPGEALEAVLYGVKRLARRVKSVVIPVDSSKLAVVNALLEMGFDVAGEELRMEKKLNGRA